MFSMYMCIFKLIMHNFICIYELKAKGCPGIIRVNYISKRAWQCGDMIFYFITWYRFLLFFFCSTYRFLLIYHFNGEQIIRKSRNYKPRVFIISKDTFLTNWNYYPIGQKPTVSKKHVFNLTSLDQCG